MKQNFQFFRQRRIPLCGTISNFQSGFTVTEILIVLGLFVMIASLAVIASLSDYRAFAFRGDRDLLISSLEKARGQAVSNVCLPGGIVNCNDGAAHGIHFGAGQYVI